MSSPEVVRRRSTTTDNDYYLGAHFCNRQYVVPERLSWYDRRPKAKVQPFTTIRPLPCYELTTAGPSENLLPWRYEDDADLTPWLVGVKMIKGYGGLVFPVVDPFADEPVPVMSTPGGLLYTGLKNAKENRLPIAQYSGLLDGGDNKGAVVTAPKQFYLMQCLVFEAGGKVLQPPYGLADNDSRLRCIAISFDAGRTLKEKLGKERKAGGDGLERFLYHDPVALDSGRFIRFFPERTPPPDAPDAVKEEYARRNAERKSEAGQESYGMYLAKTFNGRAAALTPQEQRLVRERLQDWSRVLVIPSLEQQAKLIVNSGTVAPAVLQECWADHPEYLALLNRANAGSTASYGRGASSPSGRQQVQEDDEEEEAEGATSGVADDEEEESEFETQARQTFSGPSADEDEDEAAPPQPVRRAHTAEASPAKTRRPKTDAAVPTGVFDSRPASQASAKALKARMEAAMKSRKPAKSAKA